MKPKAVGQHVFVILDEAESEKGGLIIPDSAKIKPATGEIQSVGNGVIDKEIKKGAKAIYNPHAGFLIELDDVEYWVLTEPQILGVK